MSLLKIRIKSEVKTASAGNSRETQGIKKAKEKEKKATGADTLAGIKVQT